jgi:hypothetical protein
MKEKIYTIPVTDAFESNCECPLCFMEHKLEEEAIQYVMGPSYMEDDVRTVTNELGFCKYHVEILSKQKNTLGLALMLQTHMAKTTKDIHKLVTSSKSSGGLFKKKDSLNNAPLLEYINKLEDSCYICDKVNTTMDRYIDTIFMLWNKEESFRDKLKNSKGFCAKHFGLLHKVSAQKLSIKESNEFLEVLNKLFTDNLDRVSEDLEWFIKKFDYRYQNEPWKDSKDAVQRTIIKTNGKII